jgi:trehalose 6-phosphate synthase
MHALSINPFDVDVTARAIHRALQMAPLERAERSNAINQIVATNDVARWVRHQLEDIRSLTPPLRGQSRAGEARPELVR